MIRKHSTKLEVLMVVAGCAVFIGSGTDQAKADEYVPERSDTLFESSNNTRLFTMQAQMALRNNDIDKAIELGRKAVDKDHDDLDARVVYGEALFKKYLQNKDDKRLYNECVKTWLMVHRNVAGAETGTTLKGVSMPLANRFFEDEGRGIIAKKRLKYLCGRLPKFWETNRKYLKKVLEPEVNVRGRVVTSGKEKEK